MLTLLRAIFCNKRNLLLIAMSTIAIVFLTVFNFLEILSWGIITGMRPLAKDLGNNNASIISSFESYFHNFVDGGIHFLIMLFLIIAIFKGLSLFFHSYTTELISIRCSKMMRQQYFAHIQNLSMDFYQQYDAGSLSSRIVNDSSKISEGINALLSNYIQLPFTLLATLFICFKIHFKLSLMSFVVIPSLVVPVVIFAKKVQKIAKNLQHNQEAASSILVNFFSGIQTIKLFNIEKFTYKKYKDINDKAAKLEEKNARYNNSARPIIHFFGTLLITFIIIYAFYIEQMNISEVLIFCGALHQSYDPIKRFNDANLVIQKSIAAISRMNSILSIQPTIKDKSNCSTLKKFSRTITFSNVWFSYSNHWILKNLSFSVNKGDVVAIVGPTGSGKSTIIKLLARLFDPQRGSIFIDGVDIKNYSQQSIRKIISFIPQESFLLLDSIKSNISFGKDSSLESIKHAAKIARANNFIDEIPNNYFYNVNFQGTNLSGGQRQRLIIARAILPIIDNNSEILVMDEATSSLDNVNEQCIKESIRNLKNVTQIIIAHRLSTIEHADKIIFVEDGRNVIEGDKESLVKNSVKFKNFWMGLND